MAIERAIVGILAIFVMYHCQKAPNVSESKRKAEYLETTDETILFSEPIPRRSNQIGKLPKGTKLLTLNRRISRIDSESVLWARVQYGKKEGWILGENLSDTGSFHKEDFPEIRSEKREPFEAPFEFSFDKERILKMATKEILTLEKSEAPRNSQMANDYLNLEKPIIAAVVNVDENKKKHFAIIVFFEALSGSLHTHYAVIKKHGNRYEPFGWGSSVASKREKVDELRGDSGYFMPVD